MQPKSFAFFLSVLPSVLGHPALDVRQTQDCDAVHIFLARGTSEDYPGRQISVVNATCNGISSCGYEDIQYPASFLPDYCTSVGVGVVNGTSQITAYAAKCPNAQLVLSGYSQGAQVVGNILGGQSGGSTGCTDETSTGLDPTSSPAAQIAAVTLFGDVTHTANQTYNVESGAAFDGIYPRTGTQLARLNEFSSEIRSWCLAADPVCAQGSDAAAHTSYFSIFSADAGAWIQTKLTL
ncbi:hypothetical protein J7T55_006333 [Diaporthe amygdali]|uniref:uncharacterized protein n=1 Tax=Phomopsis amygdali TaxID=1214568 RepID=UPI0022FE3AFE|nr:uncharacterized protein J7T55_006333 [Diaporthe amygdali]KAJ0124990.1 hypothetical protein J7T55_006333 [Diaporthe amygdali]